MVPLLPPLPACSPCVPPPPCLVPPLPLHRPHAPRCAPPSLLPTTASTLPPAPHPSLHRPTGPPTACTAPLGPHHCLHGPHWVPTTACMVPTGSPPLLAW